MELVQIKASDTPTILQALDDARRYDEPDLTTIRRVRRELNVRKRKTGIKLSKTQKMPKGCFSWSLEAVTHCPGSKDKNGKLVPACQGCYATTGRYGMPAAIALRAFNAEDWKRDAWAFEMIQEIQGDEFFRWFDSGDVFKLALAKKILEVMKGTPYVKHWLPTRMFKFKPFADIFDKMAALPNVVVRRSSDEVHGEIIEGDTTSTIVPDHSRVPSAVTVCDAYERGGKCGDCRACWNKQVKVIGYVAHGHAIARVYKNEVVQIEG